MTFNTYICAVQITEEKKETECNQLKQMSRKCYLRSVSTKCTLECLDQLLTFFARWTSKII